jgi:hypothetical protein
MRTRHRRNAAVAASGAPLEIQQLETRQLLTGQVAVSISKAGDVSIVGDGKANDVYIGIHSNEIELGSDSGTTFRANGKVIPAGTRVPLPGSGTIRNLTVNLKGGDDSIEVFADAAVTVAGNIRVNTGAGNDQVYVSTDSHVIDVKGSVSIATGAGNDALTVVDFDKFGIALTSADLFRTIENDTAAAGNQNLRIGKDLHIGMGGGNDVVALLGVETKRDVRIHSGLGQSDITILSNIRAGRNLSLISGDDTALRNVTVGRKLTVSSGAGNDRVLVENLTAAVANVHLGGGKDQLAIGTGVTVTGKATIRGGLGTDNIASASPIAGAKVKGFEGTTVNADAILDDIIDDLISAGLV